MKNISYIYLTKIAVLVVFSTNIMSSQNNKQDIYTSFDLFIGNQNLEIYNGAVHLTDYKTVKGKHRYFEIDKYVLVNLGYKNQHYYNLKIKYDIYKDNLVLNLEEETNNAGLNLINKNINYFEIYNRKFINSLNTPKFPNTLKKGYYEEIKFSANFILYIKHNKLRREIINETNTFVDYELKNEFFLKQNEVYFDINSKNKINKLFLNLKEKINNFYFANKLLQKDDNVKFMKELIKTIYLQAPKID